MIDPQHFTAAPSRIHPIDRDGWRISVTYDVTAEDVAEIVGTAAENDTDERIRTCLTFAPGDPGAGSYTVNGWEYRFTGRDIAEALLHLIDGEAHAMTGNWSPPLRIDSETVMNARDFLRGIDQITPETADVILQLALADAAPRNADTGDITPPIDFDGDVIDIAEAQRLARQADDVMRDAINADDTRHDAATQRETLDQYAALRAAGLMTAEEQRDASSAYLQRHAAAVNRAINAAVKIREERLADGHPW
jgi:hypothetical protein